MTETKEQKPKQPKKSPMDHFFSWGEKATKGDPFRKALYDYYLLWIIFFAFLTILIGNAKTFFSTYSLSALGWVGVMLGILWFQYFGLKQAREAMLIMKQFKNMKLPQEESALNIEKVDEMIDSFKKEIK